MTSAREQPSEDSISPFKKSKKKKKDITSLQKMKIIVKSTKTISFDGKLESSSDSENPSQKKQPAPIEELATPEQNDSQTNISVNNIVEEENGAI